MGKMNELSMILDEMIVAGTNMVKAAQALKDFYSSEPETTAPKTEPVKPEEPTKAYSKEEVRMFLAEKANMDYGKYKAKVKALVSKYADGGTLKDVKAENYPALISELEALNE